jgi:hypothetical protein
LVPVIEPWARVKHPSPIPEPLTPAVVSALSDDELAELLRGNLGPRSEHPDDRTRWASLWRLLADDDELADRAFDALEQMLDTTAAALAGEDLSEAARRRAVTFQMRCEDAWRRLEVKETGALAWAGERALAFNPEARKVIATLVGAIARHRSTRTERHDVDGVDKALWRSLRRVGLDPRVHP